MIPTALQRLASAGRWFFICWISIRLGVPGLAFEYSKLVDAGQVPELHVPTSASIPYGLYRSVEGEIVRGSLVSLCLPLDVAEIGLQEGMLKSRRMNPCPGGTSPVMKVAAATSGDWVRLERNALWVNGKRRAIWPERRPAPGGLEAEVPIEVQVPQGHIWTFSAHPRSWDSRYYGPVSLDRASVVVPIVAGGVGW